MSKKFIAVSLAVMLVGLFSTVAMAGVEGDFTFDVSLIPAQTPSAQAQAFDLDFEGLLDVSWTVSGLTISNDLAVGVKGIEHAVFGLDTTLGALTISDSFVFAMPYEKKAVGGKWKKRYVPIPDSAGNYNIQFVDQRVTTELTLAGLSFENMVMFTDVDFPDADSAYTTGAYYNSGTDTSTGNQTPTFRFGDIITISGETVSGIGVEGVTGICAQVKDLDVKKYDLGTYIPCTNDKLEFSFEEINLTGFSVGPLTLDSYTTFKFATPTKEVLDVSASLGTIGDVTGELSWTDITSIAFDEGVINVLTDPVTVTAVLTNGMVPKGYAAQISLDLDPASLSSDIALLHEAGVFVVDNELSVDISENATFSIAGCFGESEGACTYASYTFSYGLTAGYVDSYFNLAGASGSKTVNLQSVGPRLSFTTGPLTLEISGDWDARGSDMGLDSADLKVTISF